MGIGPERLEEVMSVARECGLRVRVPDPDRFVRETLVLPCEDPESAIRVDLVFSFSPYEQQAIGRARRSDIDGRPVRFALPEDLVIHKLVAGRPRDHEDVKTVLAKNPVLDLAYIRAWLRQFEAVVDQKLNDVFEGILASLNDG